MTELTEAEKTHWREILQTNYLGAHDLKGREPTVTIQEAKKEEVFCPESNKKETRLVITFEKASKPWICNTTNARRIEEYYGSYTNDWTGKKITLRTERVKAFGKVMEAVRVKPKPVSGKAFEVADKGNAKTDAPTQQTIDEAMEKTK